MSRDRLCLMGATLFGVGRIPRAPGTAASLVTLPAAYALASAGPLAYGVATLAILMISVPVCGRAADLLGVSDPPIIVLDEVAGMLIAYAPFSLIQPGNPDWALGMLGISFLLFRWFDIQKFGWIDKAQHLPGGIGIVMDDVVAGIGAALVSLMCLWISTVAIPRPVF